MDNVFIIYKTARHFDPTPTKPNRVTFDNERVAIVALTREDAAAWIKATVEGHIAQVNRADRDKDHPHWQTQHLDLDRPLPQGGVFSKNGSGFTFETKEENVVGGRYDRRTGREAA